MPAAWTIKDGGGQLLLGFRGRSRLDVGRSLVPTHYDAFRLHVSHSYRELFNYELAKVLSDKRWQIVRKRTNTHRIRAQPLGTQNDGFAK